MFFPVEIVAKVSKIILKVFSSASIDSGQLEESLGSFGRNDCSKWVFHHEPVGKFHKFR
jgi:hypothetical protein